MSAPQLTAYADGVGTVSADGLNTFVSSCDTAAELRGFVGIQGVQVYIRGTAAPNDGGQGNFYWNASGTAPDDNGATTVVPYGSGSGEWTRLNATNQNAVISVANVVAARAFIGYPGYTLYLQGTVSADDGGQGSFYWNASGTAPDDGGVTTIVPTGVVSGEWTRFAPPAAGARGTFNDATGVLITSSATAVMGGLALRLRPSTTGNFLVLFSAAATNSVSGAGAAFVTFYGTGASPAAYSPGIGTGVNNSEITSAVGGSYGSVATSGYITGLVPGTNYWFDIAFNAQGGGTITTTEIALTVIEV